MARTSASLTIRGNSSQVILASRNADRAMTGGALAIWMQSDIDYFIRQRAVRRFANEGDDVTGAWQQLAPATVDIRQSMGFPGPHPINIRTGALERYITKTPGQIAVTPGTAVMTYLGNVPNRDSLPRKVRVAQHGETRPRQVPARPVMFLGATDLEYALLSLSSFMYGVISGAIRV